MTAFADRYPRLPARSGRGVGLGLTLGLLLLLGSCSADLNAPFVQLNLTGLPATAMQLSVDVKLGAVMKTPTPQFQGDASTLAQVTISFPPDSRGTLTLAVRALDSAACVVATGLLTAELLANQVYPLPLALTAMTPTGNCQNALVPLTITKDGDGQGTVTSADKAITCGAQCVGQLGPGALVTLTAQPATAPAGSTYQFVGWTGGGCTTAQMCSLQLNQATAVKATFRCAGFCPETLPSQTNTLYGVWGFSTKSILAVGANGTIVQSDGTTWKSIPSGVAAGTSLRAIHATPGSQIGYAVGDGGTIIKTTDTGASWSKLTSGVTKALRAVLAASDTVVFALGDNIGSNSPYIKSTNGSAWAPILMGGVDYTWNAITLVQPTVFLGVAASGKGALVNVSTDIPTPLSGGTTNLNGVWTSSMTNMYAVGDNSTLVFSSGGAFSPMTAPLGGVNLHGIYGFSPTAIYAVGDGGNVWKYDSTSWKVVQSGGTTMNLYSIWGNTEADFYIVGQNGTILHNRI